MFDLVFMVFIIITLAVISVSSLLSLKILRKTNNDIIKMNEDLKSQANTNTSEIVSILHQIVSLLNDDEVNK